MAIPVRKKFKHYRGDDFRYTFRVEEYVNAEDPDQGTRTRDLTGWTHSTESNPDVGVVVNDGTALDATGVVDLFVAAEDLGDAQAASVDLDVQLIGPDGFRATPVRVLLILVDQVA